MIKTAIILGSTISGLLLTLSTSAAEAAPQRAGWNIQCPKYTYATHSGPFENQFFHSVTSYASPIIQKLADLNQIKVDIYDPFSQDRTFNDSVFELVTNSFQISSAGHVSKLYCGYENATGTPVYFTVNLPDKGSFYIHGRRITPEEHLSMLNMPLDALGTTTASDASTTPANHFLYYDLDSNRHYLEVRTITNGAQQSQDYLMKSHGVFIARQHQLDLILYLFTNAPEHPSTYPHNLLQLCSLSDTDLSHINTGILISVQGHLSGTSTDLYCRPKWSQGHLALEITETPPEPSDQFTVPFSETVDSWESTYHFHKSDSEDIRKEEPEKFRSNARASSKKGNKTPEHEKSYWQSSEELELELLKIKQKIQGNKEAYERTRQRLIAKQQKPLLKAYETLGVAYGSDKKTVSKAFRALAGKFHPDNKATGNEKQFIAIQKAYELIIGSIK